ncbi:phage holin family protein [Marinobacterium stanieri]|uniref:Putative 3TM holin, Phage_holin_3 n=1 Tax=Marinobacterium stanieri TaxID=49186 RepID=A0A1N6Q2C5_9GAMM|nr:phage holin family protein [Marinobacterium stanieri]SIQ10718.1 Putative 3TM holin, Phage_holin_3 [Marinobacterium stanieri]
MNIMDLIVFGFSAATCLRLIFYRRGTARFKRHISVLAWLVIVVTGSLALCLLTGRLSAGQIHPIGILLLSYLAIATWCAKGNLAQLIRITRGHQWN